MQKDVLAHKSCGNDCHVCLPGTYTAFSFLGKFKLYHPHYDMLILFFLSCLVEEERPCSYLLRYSVFGHDLVLPFVHPICPWFGQKDCIRLYRLVSYASAQRPNKCTELTIAVTPYDNPSHMYRAFAVNVSNTNDWIMCLNPILNYHLGHNGNDLGQCFSLLCRPAGHASAKKNVSQNKLNLNKLYGILLLTLLELQRFQWFWHGT